MTEDWISIEEDKKPKIPTIFVIIIVIFTVVTILLFAYFNGFSGGAKENQTNKTGYTTYYNSIRPFEAYSLIINNANLTIIDVRECKCAYDKGHIPEAIWSIEPENFYNSTNDLLIYCNNGTEESEIFLNTLIKHTWGSIYHLEGGIMAWEKAGFSTII